MADGRRYNGPAFRIAEVEPPCVGGFWLAVLPGEHAIITDLDTGVCLVYSARERHDQAAAEPPSDSQAVQGELI